MARALGLRGAAVMATWMCGLFLLLGPLALGDPSESCSGFQLVPGFGMEDPEAPVQGVKLLSSLEVDSDEECYKRCCATPQCDLAVLRGPGSQCHLLKCSFIGFDMCQLKEIEGARSYRRVNVGAAPSQTDFCLPAAKTGRCRASFPRWWYDAESQTCKSFTYGGCEGNLNNHGSEEDCATKCSGIKAVEQSSDVTPGERPVEADSLQGSEPEPPKVQASRSRSFSEYCTEPKFTGPCRASFQRWYFDSEAGTCNKFVFGGCKPNKNNHLTEADCVQTCVDGQNDATVHHRSAAAVALPILLAVMAGILLVAMIMFFVKVAKKNRHDSSFRAMWNPIDDKEYLVNNAYTL
ncbi:kunitz-type protease inhibitor 2 [Spea bombifrons]|uniref:kunitz-type protease inhibitor 2 n=1 Tax=Spea bombifrons TaxID=233779 RepID=UPI00234BC4C5|nr:kunitz-type protease inhibitor 2 [Spea bombifrons]